MSRHNRRRTRASHKAFHPGFQSNSFELPFSSTGSPAPKTSNPRHLRSNDLSAKHWHNRYLAWQVRERKQNEERERLKEEQNRIFGGDSQDGEDEDGLCNKMMDFFVAMDYLEG